VGQIVNLRRIGNPPVAVLSTHVIRSTEIVSRKRARVGGLDPAHETKAEKIQAALAVLGKRLTMEVEDAA
jgi:hypothetical protein